nr:uncharacterized protein LOC116151436 [Camelus dromedarius]
MLGEGSGGDGSRRPGPQAALLLTELVQGQPASADVRRALGGSRVCAAVGPRARTRAPSSRLRGLPPPPRPAPTPPAGSRDARAGAHALWDTASGAEWGRVGPSPAMPGRAGPRGGGAGPPAAQAGPAGLPNPNAPTQTTTGSRPTITSNTGPGPGRTPHSQVLRWPPHNPLTPVTAPGHTTSARHDSSPDRRDGAPSPHTEVPTPNTLPHYNSYATIPANQAEPSCFSPGPSTTQG